MKNKIFTVISLLITFTLVFASFCFAEKVKVRVVEGIIEQVTDDSIRVRGNYYNIAHVPLKNASGETLSKSYLNQGKKVEIFFCGNKMTSVLVHEYMLE
jgi:hypothetical protein